MATRTSVTRTTSGLRKPVSFPESAEFEADLKTSVFPRFGTGAISYSRASVATFTDYEGVIREVLSGEARFEGARRVQNLFTDSEFITGIAGISKSAGIINSSLTGFKSAINFTATGSSEYAYRTNFTTVSGNTYIISAFIKMDDNSVPRGGLFSYDANTDMVGVIGGAAATSYLGYTSVGNNIYRLSWKCIASSSPNNGIVRYAGNSGKAFTVSGYELEDVTAQTIKTAGEYVSTNVLSFPFHGACVDGVKYFDTDLLGNKLSPKGYYAEGGRTNLFLQSNDFTTTWAKNAAQLVITPNAAIGPDGAMSMWKLSPGVGSAVQSIVQSVTVTNAGHSFSVYAKAGENTILQLVASGSISNGFVNFDLSNGTIGSSSLWTGSIESVGNGIYRCIAITDTLVATTNNIHISQVPTRTTGRAGTISGDGVAGLYIYGAQFELGTFPSTYIPTTTATVTRNADVLSYNVANAQSNYGAAFLDINLKYLPITGVDRRAFGITGNTNNRMQIVGTTLGSQLPHLGMGNGSAVLGVNVGALSANTQVKLAAKWVNGGAGNLFQGGVKSSNLASPQAVATQFDIGNVGGAPLYGTIRNLKFWKQTPTDTELIAITSN